MKPVLDACCGSRMMWFDKKYKGALYMDNREQKTVLSDGRVLEVNPDVIADFRSMPFEDRSFNLVVFDPPHLKYAGENSWLAQKYGRLEAASWRDDIRQGLQECWRVLRPGGTLVFKWSEVQISLPEVLPLFPDDPLFGFRRGRRSLLPARHLWTHWQGHPGSNLAEQVASQAVELYGPGAPGFLNPLFVEWLMGWPIGSTGLDALEMGRFQSWLQGHSDFLERF